MSGWQPIETAPRNGEEVLLGFGHYDGPPPLTGSWASNRHIGVWLIAGTGLVIAAAPTHWQPLPEPPSE